MTTRTTVWGIGNPVLGDDGVGPEVIRLLQEKKPAGFSLRNCELAPGNYLATLVREQPELFILVDASDMGLPPGSVRRFPLDRIDSPTFTSHDLPLPLLLERTLPPGCAALVIAVQPESTDFAIGLSRPAARAAREVAETIAHGRTDEILPLEEVRK